MSESKGIDPEGDVILDLTDPRAARLGAVATALRIVPSDSEIPPSIYLP